MSERPAEMERLAPFIGAWHIDADIPGFDLGDERGSTTFEWALGGRFVLQRSAVPHPAAPDGLCVIAADPATGGYTQHYFDSRGVVRLYEMTFDGTTLTLSRTRPDFSPLDFDQRYVGCLSADGATIDGAWESREPGQDWRRDFGLTYRRTG